MAANRTDSNTPESLFRRRLILVSAMLGKLPKDAPVHLNIVHDKHALRMVMLSMSADVMMRMYLLSTALHVLSEHVQDVKLQQGFDLPAAIDTLDEIAADMAANRPILPRELLTYARKVYAVLSLIHDNALEKHEVDDEEALRTDDLTSDAERHLRSLAAPVDFSVLKSSAEAMRPQEFAQREMG